MKMVKYGKWWDNGRTFLADFEEYLRSFLKTENFKDFSSALESSEQIQVVFKEFKE